MSEQDASASGPVVEAEIYFGLPQSSRGTYQPQLPEGGRSMETLLASGWSTRMASLRTSCSSSRPVGHGGERANDYLSTRRDSAPASPGSGEDNGGQLRARGAGGLMLSRSMRILALGYR